MEKQKLLIVDDEETIRKQLKWALNSDYCIFLAGNRKETLSILQEERPKVVTLDMGLPPYPEGSKEGFRCMEDILKLDPFVKVIVITGNHDKKNALKAISIGAHDYYLKPIEIDELRVILKRAFNMSELESENVRLQGIEAAEKGGLEDIIGSSEKMKKVFASITMVAPTDIPVLITGESGTGKELVTNAIHALSKRKNGPLIPINCGAVPENLLESELFGHEKGAFTGATSQKKGKVENAHRGTLFLDEIGELQPQLQVKLLRFLQDHKIERVGGNETINVDTRVLAATNSDLKSLISEGAFREDLYYRLGTMTIEVPPLRERGDDILQIANGFFKKFSLEHKKRFKGFTLHAILAMQTYSWPGNVRELENKVRSAVLMAKGSMVTSEDLNLEISDKDIDDNNGLNIKQAKEKLESELIKKAILKNAGNLTFTAEELGISRPTLYDLIKKYGIEV